ncbi:hypothetical protein SAMN05192533_101317 [Mesobacillus persicus]|uniref:Uncharacterized protein n=1 Tax=Mesobacillus persicus TaxID=930146 RepID=A0A1H7WAH3_9BACI|nr:hypothetical protein [Mesobacillus persicus]SEM17927.1 hypothetical protein SAMN05192533_101317 [Mesobacillus persicus]
MRTFIPLGLFFILLLGVIELTINEVLESSSDGAVMVSSFKDESELQNEVIPSLEMFLVSQEDEGKEILETYREYEVYYNENGEVERKEPTSHYEYIRYKKY